MAYNNYGGYGNKGGGRPNQDRRREPPAPPEEIRPLPIPRDYVDQAENVIRGILGDYKKISTSKLRNIFSLVTDIYNVENLRTEKELPGYVWLSRSERREIAIPSAFRFFQKVLEREENQNT